MDYKLTMGYYDFRSKPVSFFVEDLKELNKKVREVLGNGNYHSGVSIQHMGELFTVMFSQIEGTKGSPNYKQYLGVGAKIVGTRTMHGSVYHKLNAYEIRVWGGGAAGPSLYAETIICEHDEPLPEMIAKEIYTAIDDFTRGVVQCSHCGTKIKKEEVAGRYFAGVYCTECWEGKYKAIEARETYN